MNRTYLIYVFAIVFAFSSCRKSDYSLPDEQGVINDQGEGTGTVTWTKDMQVLLEGFVFVNDGQTLTIEPGTVVRFKEGQGATASALIVARGGKIIANGTADEPIIFTAEADDLNGSLSKDTTGLWGGIIILGRAPLNTSNGEAFIEGVPISEPRALFGGTHPEDNSGELSYVSIRYAGTFLHEGNEINGLTLGGVGSQTTIKYVEVLNCADDGIEIFGGTVNLKNIISYNAHDDAIDYDMGYRGKAQYVLAIQNNIDADNMVEGGGASDPVYQLPESKPVFSNFTLIGNSASTNGKVMLLERFAGGIFVNSIVVNKSNGVYLEFTDAKKDSYAQWETKDVIVESNVFYQVEENVPDSIFRLKGAGIDENYLKAWRSYFAGGNNEVLNPGVSASDGAINLIPSVSTQNSLYVLTHEWFDETNYKGAFGTYDWTEGWSVFKEVIKK